MRNKFHRTVLILLALSAPLSLHAADSQRTKEFIVMGYEGISYELRSGNGPYLRTLNELLGVNQDDDAKTIEKVRALSKTHPNIMDFADQVLKLESTSGPNGRSANTAIPIPSGPHIYSGEQLENALNHLTRGMKVTVFTKGGSRFSGQFEEFVIRRLWILGAKRKSFLLDDIVAIEADQL